MMNELGGNYRQSDKFILLESDVELSPFVLHQTGLNLIRNNATANLHLQITELQRLEWIDLTIDQATSAKYEPLITGLWTKYLKLLERWFIRFKLPRSTTRSYYTQYFITSYINQLLYGSTAHTDVINYSLEILFWGVTISEYEYWTIYLFLAQVYQYIKLGQVVEFPSFSAEIKTALLKRNASYINNIFHLRQFPDKREDILVDVDYRYISTEFREQCYNLLNTQYIQYTDLSDELFELD